ncbi:MAG: alpha/beta fold hydrolase [Myxococcaceae bacterium]|nr:MAG: alpha/beta fold hydrolase [Myxococcaceae bacterium]
MNDLSLELAPHGSRPNSSLTKPTLLSDWGAGHVAELDRLLHAMEGRATAGLSLASLWLAFADWSIHLANAPFKRLELAQAATRQCQRLLDALRGAQVIRPTANDHRFDDPAWREFPFSVIHQAFLLAEEWWGWVSDGGRAVNRRDAQIVAFAIRQWIDVFSPSNAPWLNPEVIRVTRESGGLNFVAGFRNWLHNVRETLSGVPYGGDGLTVGRDLAVTPGKVVFRNEIMELIQYAPATSMVRPEPVLIVPAWIMKYYILDLSPHNSLVRYLVGQGHTVFMISWRNPGPELRDTSLDDYRTKGIVSALDAVRAIAGQPKVHGCGYCLGGTLLAIAAAAMARDGDERLASLTLFAAQCDFTEAGELQLFISESQLAFLEDLMSVQGYLDSPQMAGAFRMLRSNDLVWSHLVKSYQLGRPEMATDLMTWNADGTRLPARMCGEYLRQLFLDDDLSEGRFEVQGKPVSIADIRVPIFAVGTEADHVAPWRSVHKIHLLNEGEVTFVLASGGHNAGIVSEPGHPHRSFRMRHRPAGERYVGPVEWEALAKRYEGSWWPEWERWLSEHSGAETTPPPLGAPGAGYEVLKDAPGQYVLEH